MAENLANDISTTLNGAIANGTDTAITVTSGTGFPAANFRIRIDNEYMLVTSVGGGTNWTVTRGIESSTGVAHSDTTAVYHVLTTAGLLAYIQDNSAESGANSDITSLTALAALNTSFLTGLTEDTAPLVASDYLLSYDDSAAAYKKILPKNLFSAQNIISSAVNATTYDVSALEGFLVGLLYLTNATVRTITNFTNAVDGQVLIVLNNGGVNVTIDRSNAFLSGGANQVLGDHDTVTLIKMGSYWYQISPTIANS